MRPWLTRKKMSATHPRSGGLLQTFETLRRLLSAVVARPIPAFAAQPVERKLLLSRSAHGRYGRAATRLIPSARCLLLAATMLTSFPGLTSAGSANVRDCSWAADRLSFLATSSFDDSTEGGGHGLNSRASDIASATSAGGAAATAGGAASNPESTGTVRASRDRRGLVDAWPEVHSSSCTSRSVPGSPTGDHCGTQGAGSSPSNESRRQVRQKMTFY